MLKNNSFHNRHSPFTSSFGLGTSLALDFIDGTDTLSPAITFTRTTNATLTGSNGLIQNAPMNLLTFSEQFDNAAWAKTAVTVTANTNAAPNGEVTADSIVETTATSNHRVTRTFTPESGVTYTASIYAKKGALPLARDFFQMAFQAAQFGSNSYVNFNVSNGTLGVVGAGASNAFIEPVGDGWYRCGFSDTSTASAASTFWTSLIESDSTGIIPSYAGSTDANMLFWGAQLESNAAATTYNPTTVMNLLGFTENFDNAAWAKSNATITSGFTDIYGQPFAQQITATGADATVLSSYTAVASTPYTFSVYLQRVSGTGNVDISIDGTTWVTQTLTTTLQRFSVTGSSTAGAKTPGIRIVASGDVVIAFGAQLSDSASVDPYVYQPVAAPASTAYYGPRFDYDPVTLAPKGLLIEEQRTNLLLNSSILNTQNVTVTAAAHTLSFYGTGTIVLSGAATGTVTGTGAYPTRTTLTFTPSAGVLTVTVTDSVEMAQLELGSFATSYIPTVDSEVTRAADNASMIGNNFARWFTANEGTLFAQYSAVASGIRTIMAINDGTADESIRLRTNGTNPLFTVTDNGVDITNIDAGTVATGTSYKFAGAYALNNFAASINGGAAVTDAPGALPVNRMLIGNSSAGNYLNGTIARIAYYPRRLANTELQGITA